MAVGRRLDPTDLQKNNSAGMFLSPFVFPYAGLQSLIGPVLAAAAKAPIWLFILFWLLLWLRWAWMVGLF